MDEEDAAWANRVPRVERERLRAVEAREVVLGDVEPPSRLDCCDVGHMAEGWCEMRPDCHGARRRDTVDAQRRELRNMRPVPSVHCAADEPLGALAVGAGCPGTVQGPVAAFHPQPTATSAIPAPGQLRAYG